MQRRRTFASRPAPRTARVAAATVVALLAPLAVAQDDASSDASSKETAAVEDTATVAAQYRAAVFGERDLDAAIALLAEDARFRDRTAAVWGIPLAEGVTGRDAIRVTEEGFNAESAHYDITIKFESGEFACAMGLLDWKAAGEPAVEDIPFAIVLRVQDGLVVERQDYGDYTFANEAGAPAVEPELEAVARRYLGRYADRDYDGLAELLAEDAVYIDHTSAAMRGGGEADPVEGRDAIVGMFRGTFGQAMDFRHEIKEAFFFGHHGVVAGQVSLKIPGEMVGRDGEALPVADIPSLTILEIRDGRVSQHTSYVDYDLFMERMRYWMDEI